MTLKDLLAKKARLEQAAKEKRAAIVDGMAVEEARKLEGEHAELLTQVEAVDAEITAARAAEPPAGARRKAKAKKDDKAEDDDDAEEDDEDDKREAEEGDDKKKVSRSVMAEMVTIDTQARGLGIELNLPDAITRGETPDGMRKRLFAELAKKSKNGGPQGSAHGGASLEVIRDEREGVATAMEVALITRLLTSRGRSNGIEYQPKDPTEKAFVDQHRAQAQQYMGLGLVQIAAACIDYRPRGTVRFLTPNMADDIFTRAFHSTSDFPAIFQNALNKSLLARYELAMPTYRELATERPFNDFRPHPQVRAGEFPMLQPLEETGELKYGTTGDSKEVIQVYPYGIVFTISRQMMVNDDLSAIDQILGSAGDTVLVWENQKFFAMLNANPALVTDSRGVFDSSHGNVASPGAAPSVATIGAGREALRRMKSLSGLFINVPPRIILTGPSQETVADQMVTAITPTLTTSVNPFSGRLRSVSDANITGKEWYLFAEPGRVPCFVYGFLKGANGPRTRTFEPFGVQGVKISLEHDFGVGAIDYRGAFKSPTY